MAAAPLQRYRDCFVVKYDESKPSLEYHEDGAAYSFSLPLNDGFAGGGTAFSYLDGEAVRPSVGEALVHPGGLTHAGAAVTAGVRYLLVGFLAHSERATRYGSAA